MVIGSILLSIIIMFVTIYYAVRLAITPLLDKSDEIITYKQDSGLVKLRDIDVLSPNELDEVIELYRKRGAKEENHEQYQKYAIVLNELNKIGYFTDEVYSNRLDKLKKYFKVIDI
jgi:hypothetical protein